jgi:hypothetical protein
MQADRRRTTDGAAVAAALWTAVLFASIPLVRWAQRRLLTNVDARWITIAVLVSLAAALVAALVLLRRARRQLRPFDVVWLAGIGAIAASIAWQLRYRPEEAIHLLEYGVLAVLLYRAMRPPEPDLGILAAVVILGTLVGTVDELIQWIIPERFWGLRDIAVNGSACALAAAALWRLDPGPWRPIRPASASLALRLGAAELVLLALCFANTPSRVAWYAERVPGLSFLAYASNAMAEYGYRHELPGIGVMKSRLTLDELAARDRTDAAEVAAVLDRYPDSSYRRFLRERPAVEDPFLYEARVHIFSRDSHLRRLRDATPGSAAAREHATTAAGEQLLIERIFGNTVAQSRHVLDSRERRLLAGLHDPTSPFTSRSASHLVTSISERSLRALLLGSAVALLLVDRAIRRRGQEVTP